MSIRLEIFDLHFDVDPIGNADQVWELLASQQSGNAAYISVGNSVEPIFQLDPDEIQSLQGKRRRQTKDTWQGFC